MAIVILSAFELVNLLRNDDDEGDNAARLTTARGAALLLLGLSVSLDELAIGFTLGLLEPSLLPVLVLIGGQTFSLSQLGLHFGSRLSHRYREYAEQFAGID